MLTRIAAFVWLASLAAGPQKAEQEQPYTDTFRVEPSEWSSTGANPYFVLEPGYFLVLEGKDEDETARLTITVLDETKMVAGVETRVVEEREEVDGEIAEISRNFFAISKKTSCVFYFGEEVDIYENGKVKSHGGAWLAGEKDARFGLLMPSMPLLGARYFQEIAPGEAMDRAEVMSLGEKMETPAGKFESCLKTRESSAIEKGSEFKYYAPGIGLVREEHLLLVKYGRAAKKV
jgi:hypothetical protein